MVKNLFWRPWYWYVSRADKNHELTFLNYGYEGTGQKLALSEKDEKNRYSIQLYDFVANSIPGGIKGLDILEVGCGRGGGLNYIFENFHPRSVKGIDLCDKAVEFCKKHYSGDIQFETGDALDLSCLTERFDVVLNVESSHRYPDMDQFLSEVYRVLKPGGFFSFVDFRATEPLLNLIDQLEKSRLRLINYESITPKVLRALDLDTDRKLELIDRLVPKLLHGIAKEFATTKGTRSYRSLEKGQREYFSFVLQK